MSFKPSSSTAATISSKDIPRPTFSRSFLSGSHRNGFTEASYQQVCLCHHPCTTMTTSNVAKFPTKRCRGGGLFRPTLVHSLFKTYSLRRVGAVDKAGFVQLAHDARVDHFFGLDLADLGIARFQHSLHVAQAVQGWERFAVDAFKQVLIAFLRVICIRFKPFHDSFYHRGFVFRGYGKG